MTDIEKEQKYIERVKVLIPFSWKYYQELVAHERMSREELAAFNFKRRVETVRYAYEHTQFYRRLYDAAGITPDDLKDEAAWEALPFVTKDDLRNHLQEMIVPGTESLQKKSTTSGSTGFPLTAIVDKDYFTAQSVEWRARGWCLGRPRGRETFEIPVLGGNEGILRRMQGLGAITPKVAAKLNRISAPLKRFFFDSQSMTVDTIRSFMEQVRDEGIYHLYGYVGTIQAFAEAILDGSVDLTFHPKTITCGASVMTAGARDLIAKAFGVTPHDLLGCNEIGRIGVEDRAGTGELSVFSDIRHIDILDENGRTIHDGRDGALYVTNFDTRVMPLIKYRLGDITHWIKDRPGDNWPFPRMASVRGRETDYILDSDGKKVFGPSAAFDDYPNCVRRYQFVVHSPGNVSLRVVPNRQCLGWEAQVRDIANYWALNGRIRIALEYVDAISDQKGKIRFIVHEEAERTA